MVFFVVMGVCGCGKTTVGMKLAEELKIPFNDADDFHSTANKRKMNQGIALNDEDRLPWLGSIHKHMERGLKSGQEGVVACSSLKKKYRKILVTGCATDKSDHSIENDVMFIYLRGTASVIQERLLQRKGHFMPASLLDSQLSILEEPDREDNHMVVDVNQTVEDIIQEIISNLHH